MAGLAELGRRPRRFFAALLARPDPTELAALPAHLPPAALRLFLTMQPADQQHSLRVLRRLQRDGHGDPDLLQAALLHDVGKARARLTVWHRVAVDLGQRLWPAGLRRLAARGPRCLREPLDVALRHAELGAADLERAGCSARVVALVRGDGRDDADPELADLAGRLREADSRE